VADIYLADQFKQAAGSQGSAPVAPAEVIKLSEKELSSVVGLYWNAVNDTVRQVYVKDGKLMYFRARGNESELAPLGNNRFLMLGARTRIEVSFQSTGASTQLQMSFSEAGRTPTVYVPVKATSYNLQQLAEFAGKYYCPELGATYSVIPQ